MVTIGAAEARAALPDLLTHVEAGDEVTITRHGRPVAVMVSPESWQRRRPLSATTAAEAVRSLLQDAGRSDIPTDVGLSPDRADELVAAVRTGRRNR